jgi:4-hydroxy-tetrahydrodipicolinate synthase
MAHGGHGCISVTANVAPKLCAEFQNACMAGDFAKARTLQDRLIPLHDAMFCESSPAPAKYAASLLGKCSDEVRLPIVAATSPARERIRAAMEGAGLL